MLPRAASSSLASTSSTIPTAAVCRRVASMHGSHCCKTLRTRAYDVEVEPERQRAPGSFGAPPPPPPPPPPPRQAPSVAPNRRELLFGLLGVGIGAAGTAGYYNATYDLSDDSYAKALDALLDDPAFLDTIADEVLYKNYGDELDAADNNLDTLQQLDAELKKLKDDLERIDTN